MQQGETSLSKRYLFKLAANIVNGLVNAVTISIVPRALGSFDYGVFSYLQQFYLQLIGVLDSGSSMAFFTKLSADTKRGELIGFYLRFAFIILIVLVFFSFILAFSTIGDALVAGIPKDSVLWGMSLGFGVWLIQVLISIADANALTSKTEILKILHRLFLLLICAVLAISSRLSLPSFYFVQVMGLIVFGMAICWVLYRNGAISKQCVVGRINFSGIAREIFQFIAPLFVSTVVCGTIGLLDFWMIQKLCGARQVGYFGIAFQVACMCFIFTSAMTPVITREFSKLLAEKKLESVRTLFLRYLPMLYSTSAFLGVFIAFQAKKIVYLFAGEEFSEGWGSVACMAFYPIHQTYGQVCGALFYACGKTERYRNISIAGTLLGLVISLLMVFYFRFDALGLSIKMVVTQLLVVNWLLVFCCRDLNLPVITFIRHQVFSVAFFSVAAYFASMIRFQSDIIGLLVSALVYFVLCAAVVCGKATWIIGLTRAEVQENLGWFKKRYP